MEGGLTLWIQYSESGKAFECKNPLDRDVFVWDPFSTSKTGWDTGHSGLHVSFRARSFNSVEQQCGFSMTLPFFTGMVEKVAEEVATLRYHESWFDERGTAEQKLASKSEFIRYTKKNYPLVLDQLQEMAESILDAVQIGRDRLDSFSK